MATRTLAEATWSGGPLPHGQYEEFVVLLRVAGQPGEVLWLPAVQHCVGGATAAWTETPKPGQEISDLAFPAPSLRLAPPGDRKAGN